MFGGVVEEVSSADIFVRRVVDDRGFKDVEREKVGEFLGCRILAFLV